MAVLLGGLILHGLEPGRELLTDRLVVLFILIEALLFSNILTSILGLSFADQLAKITRIRIELLAGPIIVITFAGSFAIRNQILDIFTALTFGVIGYLMIVYGYSRVAVILALILGPIAERAFQQSLMIASGRGIEPVYMILVTRPISLILIVVTVVSLALPFVRSRQQAGDVR